MNSIKNAVVVVLLLGVAYGAYQVINAPDPNLNLDPETLATIENGIELEIPEFDDDMTSGDLDVNTGYDIGSTDGTGDLSETTSPNAPPSFQPPPTAPRLKNPEPLTPPSLDNPTSTQTAPRGTSAPNLTPPPIASTSAATDVSVPDGGKFSSGGGFTSPNTPPGNSSSTMEAPANTLSPVSRDSGANNSSFNPNPQTSLQPIVPKQNIGNRQTNPYVQNNNSPGSFDANAGNAASELLQPAPTGLNWKQVERLVSENKFQTALRVLSQAHRTSPQSADRAEQLQWLDSLAGKVIYSSEHLLTDRPYVTQADETLQSIADQWKVPAELIYLVNQNSILNPDSLPAGTELKAIPGPFDAEINTETQEMTLYLGDLYAGRFKIEMGEDATVQAGVLKVMSKTNKGRAYRNPTGQSFAANDINNPYGQYWLGLDEQTCLHSTNVADARGCIKLTEEDAAHIYAILSTESQVIFR